MTRVYVAIGVLLVLLASHSGAYLAGHSAGVDQESADTMNAVTESVAAMQTAMAIQRTESRKALALKEDELRDARASAPTFTDLVNADEKLAICASASVPVHAIWLQ